MEAALGAAVLAVDGDRIYLKYHQARKPEDQGRFFVRHLPPDAGWLDDCSRSRDNNDLRFSGGRSVLAYGV